MVAVQFAFLAAYAVALVFVSVISFKRTKTLDDFQLAGRNAVSYTHLDVYKRQAMDLAGVQALVDFMADFERENR